jgi:hypothetical protein
MACHCLWTLLIALQNRPPAVACLPYCNPENVSLIMLKHISDMPPMLFDPAAGDVQYICTTPLMQHDPAAGDVQYICTTPLMQHDPAAGDVEYICTTPLMQRDPAAGDACCRRKHQRRLQHALHIHHRAVLRHHAVHHGVGRVPLLCWCVRQNPQTDRCQCFPWSGACSSSLLVR